MKVAIVLSLALVLVVLNCQNGFVRGDIGPSGFNMFEISTRPWLYNLSQAYGYNISRLSDIPVVEFQNLADMGIDMVWMMGVWHLGEYGLKYDQTTPSLLQEYSQVLPGWTMPDVIGSPYAVTNYSINPEIGSLDSDIYELRKLLNSLGMKLMLDFVPNHSAVDCEWTTTNMDYYVRAPYGTQPPYDPNEYLPSGIAYGGAYGSFWMDTAQLNYWNPDLVTVRIQQLKYIASLADAIRCDVAYLILNDLIETNWGTQLASWNYSRPEQEFWTVAIKEVKQEYPDTIFLAEVYTPLQPTMQAVGFDYTYDKQLLDNLVSQNIQSVSSWLTSNNDTFITHSAHFLSNHDEPRAVTVFGEWYIADAAALVTYTLPGMRFFWMGDFNGFTAQLDIHLRRETAQPTDVSVWDFYALHLLPIISDPVFKYGTWSGLLNVAGSETLLAWTWEYNDEKRLCVLNFSPQNEGGTIVVSNAEPVNGNDTIAVTDLLSGTVYYRSAETMRTTGLYVLINSWYAQIFSY